MSWITVKRLPLEKNLAPLSEYLRARGLAHRITEEAGEQVIAVADSDAVQPLADLIDAYLQGNIQLPEQKNQPAPAAVGLSPFATPITLAIIALAVLGCLVVETDMGRAYLSWFTFQGFDNYRFIPVSEGILAGEYWRLVTPAFLHFGFFHLLFNSLWVWDFGRRLELGLGKVHYISFFIITAAASNIAQYWWSGASLFGGLSGVVFALVGFMWMRQQFDDNPLFKVPRPIIYFMLSWLLLCMTGLVEFLIGSGIANAAHVGGLLAGMLWGIVSKPKVRQPR